MNRITDQQYDDLNALAIELRTIIRQRSETGYGVNLLAISRKVDELQKLSVILTTLKNLPAFPKVN